MRYEIVLTEHAEADLARIYGDIASHDSIEAAEDVLNRLVEVSNSLIEQPARGSLPKELLALGNFEYRQVFCSPYRLVYRLHDYRVVIYLIADGRRDMQALLARRLLAPRMVGQEWSE